MRKIQFLMMVLLMAIAGSGQMFAQGMNGNNTNPGDTSSNNGNKTPTNDPIYLILLGESETDYPPRAIGLPFEAYIQDGLLTVGSLGEFSGVTVALYREDNVVYTQTRDFYFMDTLSIPMDGFPSGNYTLLLTTPRGTYIYSTFRL